MKKLLAVLLVLCMCAALLPAAVAEGDCYRVQLLLPTMQTIPAEEEIKKVEDAINAHIHNDLGITDFEMDLKFNSLFSYTTDTGMMLASGEKMDILYTGPL